MRGLDILKLQLFVLHNTDTISSPLSGLHFLLFNKQTNLMSSRKMTTSFSPVMTVSISSILVFFSSSVGSRRTCPCGTAQTLLKPLERERSDLKRHLKVQVSQQGQLRWKRWNKEQYDKLIEICKVQTDQKEVLE